MKSQSKDPKATCQPEKEQLKWGNSPGVAPISETASSLADADGFVEGQMEQPDKNRREKNQ